MYKRQQHSSFENSFTQPADLNAQKLQTLGMRIRQSVSNGYKLPEQGNQYSYMNDYEQQQQQASSFKRVPLPSHLANNGPPALDYNGSTASSLAGWEDEVNRPSVTLNSYYTTTNSSNGVKRGISDVNDAKEMQMDDYVQRYGPLSFNEEF